MSRKAFEKWMNQRYDSPHLGRDKEGIYIDENIALMWNAWKAQDKRYSRIVRAAKNLQGSVYLSSLPLYLKELDEAIKDIGDDNECPTC